MNRERIRRNFDLSLKLELVKQIETGKLRVSDVCKIYKVSATAVYKWLRKYSDIYKNSTRVIVESKSLSKKNKELASRIADLEAALGRKQMRIDYLERVVSNTNERLGEDIEKKRK